MKDLRQLLRTLLTRFEAIINILFDDAMIDRIERTPLAFFELFIFRSEFEFPISWLNCDVYANRTYIYVKTTFNVSVAYV